MSDLLGPPDAREVPARRADSLRRRLLAWYRRDARDLPWRRDADPYRVWVSEVMLQQTRVATATPFYQRFLERFPTVAALANARASDVLHAWAGLGYYRRARHLHEAARVVMRDHAGRIPGDPEGFGGLPGVGRYTTGAVLSIAFDQPLPVLDGNVARVLSRWFALDASVREPRGARRLWGLAAALVPMRRPGDWNQALMELGARICTPLAPRCPECPVRAGCRARAEGRVAELPPAPTRRATEAVRRAIVRIGRGPRVLMTKRTGALLAGLWEPPGVELAARAGAARALRAELARLGIAARLARTDETVKHVITHRAIAVEVFRGELAGVLPRTRAVRWVDPLEPDVAITALARRVGAASAVPSGRRRQRGGRRL